MPARQVIQGTRALASDNRPPVARLLVEGLPPAPAGSLRLWVELDVDQWNSFNISVKVRIRGWRRPHPHRVFVFAIEMVCGPKLDTEDFTSTCYCFFSLPTTTRTAAEDRGSP